MKRNLFLLTALSVPVVATAVLVPLRAYSQSQRRTPSGGITPAYKSEVKIEERDGQRIITANGIPDHTVGQFPGPGNPNTIAPQSYRFQVPLDPKPSEGEHRGQVFGIAVNGVVFDPGTAELWNGNFAWHYEALSGFYAARGSLGADENYAHVQPNGAYHYHGLPMGLLKKLDYKNKMGLVGYAADGFPIYGLYAYSDPNDPKSPMKRLVSSYKLKSGDRPGGDNSPGGAYDGSFASDYEFAKGSGDLDEFNGRFGVTPEYPKGTFYYVLTDTWPFVPRKFRGTPDRSFQKGPGGPGGGGRQGGGRPGGFGQGGGPGGPGGRGFGPPPGQVPSAILTEALSLTDAQKAKLARLIKVIDALRTESFIAEALPKLKLTDAQLDQLAKGEKVRTVLTEAQQKVLDENQRPGGFPGGGPGGLGGPGGPPQDGPPSEE